MNIKPIEKGVQGTMEWKRTDLEAALAREYPQVSAEDISCIINAAVREGWVDNNGGRLRLAVRMQPSANIFFKMLGNLEGWSVLDIQLNSSLNMLLSQVPGNEVPSAKARRLELAIRAHRDALGDFYEEADLALWEELSK